MILLKRQGFTIIEVMLFLSISGLLMVMVMAGASSAISAQRYKDAVATLRSDMQQQYEDVISVKNSRDAVSSMPTCSGIRGQTNCVVLGKLMTITSVGVVTQYTILGTEPAGSGSIADEFALLRAYNPVIISASTQQSQMEWGTGIAWPISGSNASTAPRDIGLLVIRSPRSGLVYTFTRDIATTNNLSTMIQPSARGSRTICVTTTGWVVGDKMAISLAANAASTNAIQVRSNEMIPDTELVC